jgi:hypothetical protein
MVGTFAATGAPYAEVAGAAIGVYIVGVEKSARLASPEASASIEAEVKKPCMATAL